MSVLENSVAEGEPAASTPSKGLQLAGVLLLVGIASTLFYYKWGASLQVVGGAQESGKLGIAIDPYVSGGAIAATLAYLKKVWIALAYGVVLGGTLRVVVSPAAVAQWLGGKGAKSMLTGAIAGVPLMLCSCCVTPIFSGLHRQGARLGPALAVMLAAPGLNVAALVLTFILFPASFGVVRIAASLLLVFGVASVLGQVFERDRARKGESEVCTVTLEAPLTWSTFPARWLRSVAYMAAMTLPLVVVGVLASTLIAPYLGSASLTHGTGAIIAIALVALVSTMVALPTFLELPLALSLLAAGAPPGVAVAVLISGPVVNLPSLLVLAREVSPRVAVYLFLSVWLMASAAGFVANLL